jgi:energy-coupling factor transport system substrate-specific component
VSGNSLYGSAIVGAAIVLLLALRIYTSPVYGNDPSQGGFGPGVYVVIAGIGVIAALAVVGFILYRRDAAGAWVAAAGAVTGIIAAIVSAPIAAYLFEGVTGSGADLIVAALRQGGADVFNASLGQGLFSDPIDKTITSFVVYMILSSLSVRFIARFPLGERLAEGRAF